MTVSLAGFAALSATIIDWADSQLAPFGASVTDDNVRKLVDHYMRPWDVDGRPVDRHTWDARKHAVITRRTQKGTSTQRVTRGGVAFVIGAHDIPTLLAMCGRKVRGGWDVLAVRRATDVLYRHDHVPALAGTELRAFAEVIPGDVATAAEMVGAGSHTCDTAGYLNVTSAVRDIVAGERRDRPETRLRWPTRVTLRKPTPRKGERETWGAALVTSADRDDRVHVGATTIDRPTRARRNGQARREARTIAAYRVETIDAMIDALRATTIAPGERVTFSGDDFRATITRGRSAAAKYNARVVCDGADPVSIRGSRSVGAVADRVAILAAQ